MTTPPLAAKLANELAPYLGEFNARIAVKTFSKRAFDLPPEELTFEHLPGLLEALRPMLNTLAGQAATERVFQQIQREMV